MTCVETLYSRRKKSRHCGPLMRYRVIILATLGTGLGSIPYGVWTHARADGVWILYRIYRRRASRWWQWWRVRDIASSQKILLWHKLQHLMVVLLLRVTNSQTSCFKFGKEKHQVRIESCFVIWGCIVPNAQLPRRIIWESTLTTRHRSFPRASNSWKTWQLRYGHATPLQVT